MHKVPIVAIASGAIVGIVGGSGCPPGGGPAVTRTAGRVGVTASACIGGTTSLRRSPLPSGDWKPASATGREASAMTISRPTATPNAAQRRRRAGRHRLKAASASP